MTASGRLQPFIVWLNSPGVSPIDTARPQTAGMHECKRQEEVGLDISGGKYFYVSHPVRP